MSQARILIVEDDDDTRLAMRLRLQASGFAIAEAIDTPSAVAAVRDEHPDLVLLDLGLPGGGGLPVIEAVRRDASHPSLPIVVLSASDAHSVRDRVIEAGASAYVEKLTDTAKLLEVIRQHL